jgi:transposase
MIVVDGSGIPLGCLLDSASPAEVRLAEATLNDIHVPKGGKGRTRSRPKRVIADKAYDSDGLRASLKRRGITLISPYKKNRTHHKRQNQIIRKRYGKRWIVERTFAWIACFRRLVVRYEHHLSIYSAFFNLVCAMITLKKCMRF